MITASSQASRLILDHLGELARAATGSLQSAFPSLWDGVPVVDQTERAHDMGDHFAYLAEALAADDPRLFLDYIAWTRVLFASLDLPLDALATTLTAMREAVQALDDRGALAPACAFIDAAFAQLPHMPETLTSPLVPTMPLHALAVTYLEALLQGDRERASRLILDAVQEGTEVGDIYRYVFEPCLHEVGRLWQLNRVSVAQEHFCTAATQLIMSQLYPAIFETPKRGCRVVATAVGDDLHEIGVRMVADFLEMAGWDTYYLGASTPAESVVHTVAEREADLLLISATLTLHVSKVATLIRLIRSTARTASVKVLVGGAPFNVAEGLWERIGADGHARDAQEAITLAAQLVRKESP